MVFPHGRAILGFSTFHRHPRPHNFRQPINIHGADTHALFHRTAQLVGPGLGPENAQTQTQGVRINALALHLIGDIEHVRRGHHDDVRIKITDQAHLFLGLPTGHGNHSTAQTLSTVMSPQTTSKQPIAIGDMRFIAGTSTGGADRTGHQIGPVIDIALGITHHGRLASGTAGGVQTHYVFHRCGEHTVRVVIAQIGFGGERQSGQIIQRLNVLRVHTCGIKALTVQRNIVVGMTDAPLQALQLVRTQFINAGMFHRIKLIRFELLSDIHAESLFYFCTHGRCLMDYD